MCCIVSSQKWYELKKFFRGLEFRMGIEAAFRCEGRWGMMRRMKRKGGRG